MNHVAKNARHANVAATHRRRLRRISLCAVVALAGGVSSAQAQAVTVGVHSGNGVVGTPDSDVRIVADPTTPTPRAADIIAKHQLWGAPIGASQWLSNSPNGASSGLVGTTRYVVDLPPLPNGAIGATLTGSFYLDDRGTVRVNNIPVAQAPTTPAGVWDFTGTPTPFTSTLELNAGLPNTLTFDVANSGGATGLDFDANLTYTQGPLGPPAVDHFKCYTVKPTSPRKRAVTLADQFGVKKSTVRELRELCNPVLKIHGHTVSKPQHPGAHLVCRRTVDHGGVLQHAVRLRNQFGVLDTVTTGSRTLCLPSLKRKLKGSHGVPPTGPNPEKVLDHFRCYAVEQRDVAISVMLRDQFGIGPAKVVRLAKLCNPVRKTFKSNVSKIKFPQTHLACYAISDAMKLKPLYVSVRNQFGIRKLRVLKARTLCVPTFKELLVKNPIVNPPLDRAPVPEPFGVSLTATQCAQGQTIVHTVAGRTSPAHPFATAIGVLSSGRETFPAETVAVGADGTWTAQTTTPSTPGSSATYSWDWTVTDIDDVQASASIPVVVNREIPRC